MFPITVAAKTPLVKNVQTLKPKLNRTLSHEVVLQNYDIIDVWLSVFSYAITLELLNLLLCLLA